MIRLKRKNKHKSKRTPRNFSMLSEDELPQMRAAGQLAAALLDMVGPRIQAGITTDDIDNWVQEMTEDHNAISAPFGYHGFPAHCCTSVNDVVCHGIPDPKRVLKDGDIINVDVTPILDGYYGDCSRTFFVGEPTELAKKLVETTYESLWRGIAAVKPNVHVGDIGYAIQQCAELKGYSVVRQFTGHGIATDFHTEPQILHYGEPGKGDMLPIGTSFTIEPMINLGDWRCQILDDNWTAVTVDGKLSAQFEHTMVITETGVEIFTLGAQEKSPLLKNV